MGEYRQLGTVFLASLLGGGGGGEVNRVGEG